ncbi:MAG: Gfo/Idh/MocA family oxidoreductase [Acidobacteriia bacterium]|nr:Gfo/Idh/MocA family oxidoreductase [Terriglobia bacterium]
MERRKFVKTSVAAAMTAASRGRVYGANERINIGLIGCGGRGTLDTRLIRGSKEDLAQMGAVVDGKLDPRLSTNRNVAVTALSDVWQQQIDKAKQWAPEAQVYHDFRKMLDNKDVHAVVIATQDQWHAPMAVLAAQAGKDIYLEKPVMYTIHEGRAVINAVRRNKVICQIGSQHRSSDHIAEAARMVQSGKIGQVTFVRVWNNLQMRGAKPSPDAPVPAGLDWDAWLGPAPKVPFNPDRLSYRNFMAYTNGLITDYGMHRFDSVHQIMGQDTPRTVSSSWGHYRKNKAGDLPDIHQATYEYPGFILSYECCTMNSHGLGGRTPGMKYYGASGPEDRPHGMAFYGTEAALFVDRIGMELYSEPKGGRRAAWEPIMEKMAMNEAEPTPMHGMNFVTNLRERKEPFANIEVGVTSTIAPILGNVAAKADQKLKWDAGKQSFIGNSEADIHLFRAHRKPWDYIAIKS